MDAVRSEAVVQDVPNRQNADHKNVGSLIADDGSASWEPKKRNATKVRRLHRTTSCCDRRRSLAPLPRKGPADHAGELRLLSVGGLLGSDHVLDFREL
jgi:hypothetical protein